MAIYFSAYRGLGNPGNTIDPENYKSVILKIGISKLPPPILKGHQFYSANSERYHTDSTIRDTINDYLNDLNAYVKTLSAKQQKAIFETDKGYSGHKWTGSHYKQARGLKTSEIAKLIKKELDIVYDGVARFSVVSDVFTGGSSIGVSIKDVTFNPYTEDFLKALKSGKSREEFNLEHRDQWNRDPERFNETFKDFIKGVDAITNKYNFDDSDSQTDYFHVNYYDSVSFDEDNYLLIHYPDHPDAKRKKEWDEHWDKQKKASKAKADAKKGKFKKGDFVFYNAHMHASWEKYKLPNGLYLVKILKSPNGRALFSNYSISILMNVSALNENTRNYHHKNGTDKHYITNDYGTFYWSGSIPGYEENMIPLNDPKATFTVNTPSETKEPEPLVKTIQEPDPVTVNTYLKHAFDTSEWPEQLKKVHEFIIGETNGFKNMALYVEDESIRALIDKHIAYLNLYLKQKWKKENHKGDVTQKTAENKTSEKERTKTAKITRSKKHAKPQRSQRKDGVKKVNGKNKNHPKAQEVKQVALSVKFIKRYAALHGKTITEKQLSAFIKSLQRAMLTKLIRKTDPHQEMILHIQDELVREYNALEPDQKIEFTIKEVEKYKAIGRSETELLSARLLKRYVALIGKTDKEKHRKLYNAIDLAIKTEGIAPDDKLLPHLRRAAANLLVAVHGSGKLNAAREELDGLQGLGFIPLIVAAAVGKGVEHFTQKALNRTDSFGGLGCDCKKLNAPVNGLNGISGGTVTPSGLLPASPLIPDIKATPATGAPSMVSITKRDQNPKISMSVNEALRLKFDLLGLDGHYVKLIGEACRPTSLFIYGAGGGGKSTFTLLFGNYLAQKGNRVLYVAGEQYGTPVFSKMLARLKIKDSPRFTIVKFLDGIDLTNYDVVVIDSKDSLGYELEDFKRQRERYPKLTFVILSQGTKSGSFTGTEKWRNEVDTLIYCENMVVYTNRDKNRWGGAAQLKINALIPNR